MNLLLYISFIGIWVTLASSSESPIVLTAKGRIQGEILETVDKQIRYASFKGIPFAEPPLGNRRFKPPVEKEPWSHVLKTTVDGSNCIQKDLIVGGYTGSEDCLYLNVYTPKTNFLRYSNTTLRPVMVWIYGGKFLHGHANSSLHGPDYLVEEGVIVVTFNYRLGPLGFLNLNHEDATGNTALKDQHAVLKWVNQNIWRFGGNKNSVTIFGQSAGGSSVDFHILSEMSKGLFHKSISMSGSPLVEWSFQKPDEAIKNGFKLGKILGIKTRDTSELLKALYNASALQMMIIAEEMTTTNPAFRPTIEDVKIAPHEEKFLTECPKTKYSSGRFNKGPHMMGIMKDEAIGFGQSVSQFLKQLEADEKACSTGYWSQLRRKATNMFKNMANKIVVGTATTIYNVATKFYFIFGIDKKQRMMADSNKNPVYYYRISADPEFSLHRYLWDVERLRGAAHGDDVLYLFHTNLVNVPLEKENLVTRTREKIVKLWTNFAKYGNPSPSNVMDSTLNITWPHSGKNGAFLDIRDKLTVVTDRVKMFPKFWNEIFNLIKDETC